MDAAYDEDHHYDHYFELNQEENKKNYENNGYNINTQVFLA